MKNPILIGFGIGLLFLMYLNSGNSTKSEKIAEIETGDPSSPSLIPAPKAQPSPSALESTQTAGFAPIDEGEDLSTELAQEIQRVKRAIPKLTELKTLSDDETHGTPSLIIEAGAALGDLEEFLERKPEEFKSASRFFSDCAAGQDLPPAIRAMCLHSLQNNPTQWAPGVSAKLEGLPPDVLELEAQL
jgi:hypothetical protein